MKTFFFLSFSFFVFLPAVLAHGFLSSVTIDGRTFKGNVPYDQGGQPYDSIIRRVASEGPVKGATNSFLSCGVNSTVGSVVGEAEPGSRISYRWQKAGYQSWDHKEGPIIASITECSGLCRDNHDLSNASWAVLAQFGKVNGSFPAQEALYRNETGNFTLPTNLARGQYVVRVEIIALFDAEDLGGAEFYPGCFQIQVEGNEAGRPSPTSILAKYPGSYSDTDPGILDANIYDVNAPYTIPGPGIATFVSPPGSNTIIPTSPALITGNQPVTVISPFTGFVTTPSITPSAAAVTPSVASSQRRKRCSTSPPPVLQA